MADARAGKNRVRDIEQQTDCDFRQNDGMARRLFHDCRDRLSAGSKMAKCERESERELEIERVREVKYMSPNTMHYVEHTFVIRSAMIWILI
jgi:hypothetical protein